MRSRPFAVFVVALALLLPSGAALTALHGDPGQEQAPADPASLAHALDGASLRDLPHRLLDLLGSPSGTSSSTSATDPALLPFTLKPLATGWREWLLAGHATRESPELIHGSPAPGAQACLTGAQVIATDQEITGSVCYDNADITFTTPGFGHRLVRVADGGALTITNSVVHNDDGNRAHYGILQSSGGLVLDSTTFHQVVVFAAHGSDPYTPDAVNQVLTNNVFDNAPFGVFTDRSKLVLQGNVFTNDDAGLWVHSPPDPDGNPGTSFDDPAYLTYSNPVVTKNTFEMNAVGILVHTDQFTGNPEATGAYAQNTIRANIVGVQCLANTWVNPQNNAQVGRATFTGNNIYTNWGDAVNDLRGVTITTSFGAVEVPDSACLLRGNHFGPDSLFLSSKDTVASSSGFPLSLPGTPPLPAPISVVAGAQTWSAATPAPAITGPVIVAPGSSLTITQPSLATAFPVGASKGGRLILDGVTISNGNGIVLRNDADAVRNSRLLGSRSLDPLTVFRNNATVDGTEVAGSTRALGSGITLAAGQFNDDATWSPTVTGNTLHDLRFGVTAVTQTVTLQNNSFRDIGLPGDGTLLGGLVGAGITGSQVTWQSRGNSFTNVINAAGGQLVTLNSNGDRFDRGFTAFNSALLNTVTLTNAVVSGYEYGLAYFVLDRGLNVGTSNFTYNAYGLLAVLNSATVTGSNFYNNYLQAVYPYPATLQGTPTASTVTCTTCWMPADEAVLEIYGSKVALTPALAPNAVPSPPWAASAREVVGTGQVLNLAGGTLAGPVIARQGGELRLDGITLDLAGFPLGAKGGGRGGGATGLLSVRGSDLTRGGFVAFNSTAAAISGNHFGAFAGTDALLAHFHGATVTCNDFQLSDQGPLQVLDLLSAAGGPLLVERNRITGGRAVANGLPLAGGAFLGGDTYHNEAARVRFERNLVADGTSPSGAVLLTQGGQQPHSVQFNNFVGNVAHAGLTRASANWSQGQLNPAVSPVATAAGSNWWGDASGPSTGLNPSGSGLSVSWGSWPPPSLTPFAAAPVALAPCVDFAAGANLVEATAGLFTDRSFDPSGSAIASRTWNFGDGSGNLAGGASMSHVFPDGGAYTVTLTVATAGGQTGSVSKAVQVGHLDPVPDFTALVADELTPVQFTDASSHPNPGDAPPSGWTYAWNFAGTGSSNLRNPTFRFPDGGPRTVTLIVTDNDGRTASISKVVAPAQVGPVAGIVVNAATELTPVQFSDASSHPNPADGPATGWLYAWNFNGEGVSNQRNPSFRFADGGSKTVTLTVTDNDGLSSSASVAFNLAHAPPAPSFRTQITAPRTLQFTDTSTHPNPADQSKASWSFLWDFGDGGQSTSQNPLHTFAVDAVYTVCLTATDNDGQAATACRSLNSANLPPNAAFGWANQPQPTATFSLQYQDQSTDPDGAIVAWAWQLGDGTTSTNQNPSHTYARGGDYLVNLTVTDNDGAQTTVQRVVHICETHLDPGPGAAVHFEFCTRIRPLSQ